MITKKCALSFAGFALSLLLGVAAMHIMSLFNISQWAGVCTGAGVLAAMLVISLVMRKNPTVRIFAIIVNALASGIAASSLFVYLGSFPKLWETAAVCAALCAAFLLYLLLTNIAFFRERFVLCMIAYAVIVLAGLITGAALTKSNAFYLALLGMIPFIAFFVTTACSAENDKTQIKYMAYASFAVLVLVILVVLTVLSEGDGLDGLDGFTDGLAPRKDNNAVIYNPYTYRARKARGSGVPPLPPQPPLE